MKEKKKIFIMLVVIVLMCALGCAIITEFIKLKEDDKLGLEVSQSKKSGLIDDWKYDESEYSESAIDVRKTYSLTGNAAMESISDASIAGGSKIGYTVGGSKNINNFRENIKEGYFPISTDITYNGLFYDYYFDKGADEESTGLFSPTYSVATSMDPISGELEYYMTVGLNSNIKADDFKRKKLNLVVVMDISGSMNSGFNSYYYDEIYENLEKTKSKMQIANESLNLLLDELNEDDRIGIVLFDDQSYLAKPMNVVGETDIDKIKEHVLEIQARGGTNFDAGYTSGTDLFTEEMLSDSEYENRIIVITDAMPNMGNYSRNSLRDSIIKNAENRIYTTFIGVGVDFNTDVIEHLSDVRGANYYSVHSAEEFGKIMGEDFDYMVTPLVFDLELNLESDVFEIENVYGTDTKDSSSGTIMKVNTLFPSSSNSNGETKGGIILLKLRMKENMNKEDIEKEILKLSVSYKNREEEEFLDSRDVQFKNIESEEYDNTGIRKGILLTRYVNLMKNWIMFERTENRPMFLIDNNTGIADFRYTDEQIYRIIGENERASTELSVSEEYAEIFSQFKDYMKNEINEIGDDEMKQEIEILEILSK